jgi:hypothetical protein
MLFDHPDAVDLQPDLDDIAASTDSYCTFGPDVRGQIASEITPPACNRFRYGTLYRPARPFLNGRRCGIHHEANFN